MEKNKPNPIAEVFSYAHDKKLIGTFCLSSL